MAAILVIEDNALNRKLVRLILEKAGHQVWQACDAEQGLACAFAQQPDLILMDMQLPGISGLDATRRLKADPRTQRIPVIAVTAMAMMGDEARCRAAGCDDYIT
ncbi:MAG TPA: response regulator, partial [Noviherbaspirillum sp.]|nr:response regulator [Noviherbaspirillum sp.]